MTVVLDSSAVLAALLDEPGRDSVAAVLDGALISSVNLSEVVAKLVERGATDDEAARTVAALPFEIRGFDTEAGLIAGILRRDTRRLGLSLGDRACLALAIQAGGTVLTTDRAWVRIETAILGDIEIQVVR